MAETANESEKGKIKHKWRLILTILLLIIFNISIRIIHLKEWYNLEKIFFISESKPLMTTLDAYYYLRIASDYKKGNFDTIDHLSPIGTKPRPVALLPLIASTISTITNTAIEKVAFYLPVFLSCFMIIVYCCWGLALTDEKLFIISGLVGSSILYWYSRTCLGRFDTDSLLPFFVFIIPYLTYRFSISSNAKSKIKYVFLIICTSILFFLWWIPARYLIFPLVLLTYSIGLFCTKSSKPEQITKILILASGIILTILTLLMAVNIIPTPAPFRHLIDLLQLSIHKRNSGTPDISVSISELLPLSLRKITSTVSGNSVILIGSLVGLAWLIIETRKTFIFLSVPLILALLSLKSQRFMIFYVPFFAMGIAFFICKVASVNFLKKNNPAKYFVISILALITLYFVGKKTVKAVIPPNPLAPHASIASAINDGYKPEETVWSWWDYGYFLEYMTGKRAFIDGGSQSGMRSFIASFPLAQPNPQVAAFWIRLFARNERIFWNLTKFTKSKNKTVEFLKKVFQSPDQIGKLAEQYKLPSKNWKSLLFPPGKVYLYLPFDMIDKAIWWFYFGTWDFDKGKGYHPVVLRLSPKALLNQKKGILILPSKRILLKDTLTYSATPKIGLYATRLFGNLSDRHLITSRMFSYVVDTNFLKSTFAKLIFSPKDVPLFRLIKYVPYYGGIWEVTKGNLRNVFP